MRTYRGRNTKQNIENFKSKSTPVVKTTNQQHPEEDKPTLPTSSKLKRKAEAEEVEIPVPKKLAAKVTSTPSYHVSSAHQSKAEKKQKKREAQLDTTKQEKIAESSTPGMKTSIPEGFFDDPTVDAKVRKVEVKNTAEEEWVKFQKEMEQQQQASQVILEADEAASQVSRNITEIDEQIQRFANVEKLRDKQDEWKAQKLRKQNMSHEDSGGSEDEEDYAEFLDWRSKGAFK
ncbi:putative zinc finger protein [Apostichopus japonicus]|uniref:Putative zinc finger protein n=1 Tax=Stichopus japonicus TaxID=307972 RepID=A0A2G8JLM6_STIJA|nr:putative zinc finger protein [Apostichopus japonicus]